MSIVVLVGLETDSLKKDFLRSLFYDCFTSRQNPSKDSQQVKFELFIIIRFSVLKYYSFRLSLSKTWNKKSAA